MEEILCFFLCPCDKLSFQLFQSSDSSFSSQYLLRSRICDIVLVLFLLLPSSVLYSLNEEVCFFSDEHFTSGRIIIPKSIERRKWCYSIPFSFHIFMRLANLWFIHLEGQFSILRTRSFPDLYLLIRLRNYDIKSSLLQNKIPLHSQELILETLIST